MQFEPIANSTPTSYRESLWQSLRERPSSWQDDTITNVAIHRPDQNALLRKLSRHNITHIRSAKNSFDSQVRTTIEDIELIAKKLLAQPHTQQHKPKEIAKIYGVCERNIAQLTKLTEQQKKANHKQLCPNHRRSSTT
jgi:hypothetical protein